MIEWRRVVQEYPCMVCGAPPGRKCVTKSGATAYTPHYLRSRAASDNQWRDPGVTKGATPTGATPRR